MSYGMTVPFDGVPLAEHRDYLELLVGLGYDEVWSSEAGGTDAFTPLALAGAWEPTLRLGTAIAGVFTRGPALLAQSAAAMAEAAPGRFTLGVGTSSDVIVERWNGLAFDQPYRRARDVVRFLRQAFTGARVDERYDTFAVAGFRLERPPAVVPPVLVAALRPAMLRLAGAEADGAILNWLSAGDVARAVAEVGPGARVVARIFVCPEPDPAVARRVARRAIAAYLNVPVYASFHRWLGRGPLLEPMWEAWQAGDRRGALAAIPDQVVDDLVVHGPPAAIASAIRRYVDNGVTTPVVYLLGVEPAGLADAIRRVAPVPSG